jgi:hypothetical protein
MQPTRRRRDARAINVAGALAALLSKVLPSFLELSVAEAP